MDQNLTIRRAVAVDASAILALTRAAYAPWVPLIGREPKPMGADYEAAVLTHLIDMLYVAGILVGLIEMIPRPDHLLIENIAVSPPHHGHGYGRLLMDHAEKQALSFGLSEMKLYTNKKFARNITLYRRLGYRVEREETIEAGVVVHMSKSL